jgi:hypothetical protein
MNPNSVLLPHYSLMIRFFSEIHLGNLVLRDPVTALTNVLIVLAGLWCWKNSKSENAIPAKRWSLFFLMIGLSSLVGVVVHGFSYYTAERTHFWIWITMGAVQGLGISFAQGATVQQYFTKQRYWLFILIAVQYAVLLFFFILSENYKAVKWHVAIGMLPVMGWNIYRWAKGELSGKWIALGVLVSGLTAAVHGFKISISLEWFNFNDIAHILIVISLFLIYKGVKTIVPAQ